MPCSMAPVPGGGGIPGVSLPRCVLPELLDELEPHDPRAVRSRRDLRRVHRLMRTRAHLLRALDAVVPARPRHLVELGAGDGTIALALARRRAQRWREARLTLVDLRPAVDPATARAIRELGWSVEVVAADALDWLERGPAAERAVAFAVLFVHHFEGERLERLLGGVAARADAFVCFEPRRSHPALAGSRLLGLVGCGPVTRHDAPASVRAGFRGAELSAAWGAGGGAWALEERLAAPFGHRFAARRVAAGPEP